MNQPIVKIIVAHIIAVDNPRLLSPATWPVRVNAIARAKETGITEERSNYVIRFTNSRRVQKSL